MIAKPKPNGLDFDASGPRIGTTPLLIKSALGFAPRSLGDLAEMLGVEDADRQPALRRFRDGLARVAQAMTLGDTSLAAITTGQLSLGSLSPAGPASKPDTAPVGKAAVDDPKHPGYPARTPGRKGGQFRPKNGTGTAEDDVGGPIIVSREDLVSRITKRRGFRAAVRRILTIKRVARLLSRNVVAGLTEAIPGLDVITDAEAIAEDVKALEEIAAEVRDSDAALNFLNRGPVDLSELQVSAQEMHFSSFEDLKKIELEKIFGAAGDGLDYHHIVEQGPNAGAIANELLQSTENIVKIPRLLHEEINSIYNTATDMDGQMTTPRDYLRGRSYDEQRAYGLRVLRELGIIY